MAGLSSAGAPKTLELVKKVEELVRITELVGIEETYESIKTYAFEWTEAITDQTYSIPDGVKKIIFTPTVDVEIRFNPAHARFPLASGQSLSLSFKGPITIYVTSTVAGTLYALGLW